MHHLYTANKPYYKSLVRLGVPIIIGQLGAVITGLADTVMVGQHSTAELAAASFVNNVLNAFIILGTGFSFNLTPLIGGSLARNKKWEIGGWLKNSLMANLGVTVLLLFILAVIYLNIEVLHQPEELLPLIKPYFLVTASSLVFVMLYNSFRQFVEGIAQPAVSMWVLLAGNVLNIIGNYMLIYGKFGLPELGLLGAGVSTLFSRVVMLLAFIVVFVWRSDYRPYRKGFVLIPIDRQRWKRLNAIGLPIGIQQGMEAATFSVTAIMVGWLGSFELAAHQIVIAISTVSYTIYLGWGSAVAIRASYYKGAGDWMQVRRITLAGIHLGLVTAFLLCVVMFLTRSQLGLFFTDDADVVKIVILVLPIMMLYQLGDTMQIVLANALRGLADVKAMMWISFVAYFVVAMPSGYLFGFVFHWGISGIWMAYPVGFLCCVLLFGQRVRTLVRRHA